MEGGAGLSGADRWMNDWGLAGQVEGGAEPEFDWPPPPVAGGISVFICIDKVERGRGEYEAFYCETRQ